MLYPPHTSNKYINKSNLLTSSYNNSYCLKIYFHVIRKSDGTGGQTTSRVNQAYQILNQDFALHNITFYWDNTINYINNTTYYNYPSSNIFNVNNHQDGIDIYLYDNNAYAGGFANGVGNSSEFYVAGTFSNPPYFADIPLITSHVISHEMGHVLFLWHTHHGTYSEGGNDNPCPELVDGSNSSICGDYIADTPADPHIQFNVSTHCQWTGSGVDANGDSYDPDEENIMSYSVPQCLSYFTPMQGARMRNSIASLPYLQQAIASCCIDDQSLTLLTRNSVDDMGVEPDNITTNTQLYKSPDIWIRNANDNGLQHQNPEYDPNNPNYVYVRITNKSCETFSGNGQLKLYWAKAASGQSWPYNWTGNYYPNGGSLTGDIVGTQTIPSLEPGEEAVVNFPWHVPNPEDYANHSGASHFCLLSRIVSQDDPMSFMETSALAANVRNNNNIAWKNVIVVDIEPNSSTGGRMVVGNLGGSLTRDFTVNFGAVLGEGENGIWQEAEVNITLDENLWNIWSNGDFASQNIQIINEAEHQLRVTDNHARLLNMNFSPEDWGTIEVSFNFLTEEVSDQTVYNFDVTQEDSDSGEFIGGVGYQINRVTRDLFQAEAQQSDTNNSIQNYTPSLQATSIGESAIYNWYNPDNELVYRGQQMPLSSITETNYMLEVIAESDGYKDYDIISIRNPYEIISISPNSANLYVTIEYQLPNSKNASISITSISGNQIANHILKNDHSLHIDISNYTTGIYIVSLVYNGKIIDTKNLIIE